MYGSLIPVSGGEPIPLKKRRLYMGRTGGDRSVPLNDDNACCLLQLIDGWWHVEDLHCPEGLKINGRPVKRERLMTGDEIAFGRHRFRINFEPPRAGAGQQGSDPASRPARRRPPAARPPQRKGGPLGRLVPVGGGADYRITQPVVTIGRRKPCNIIIPVRTVSGQHCELRLTNGYWRARDLGSHNGIRIDGTRCDEGWVLPRHRLSIAEQRFLLEYEGEGPPPVADAVTSAGDVSRSLMDRLGLRDDDFADTDEQPEKKRRWRPF